MTKQKFGHTFIELLLSIVNFIVTIFKAALSGRNLNFNWSAKALCSEVIGGGMLLVTQTRVFEEGGYRLWRIIRFGGRIQILTPAFQLLWQSIFVCLVIFVIARSAYTFVWAVKLLIREVKSDRVRFTYVTRNQKRELEKMRKEREYRKMARKYYVSLYRRGYQKVARWYV